MTQLELFDYGEPDVPIPKKRARAVGWVSWLEIKNVRGIPCEDCMSLYTEMPNPPMARRARLRRMTAEGDLLLCRAHAAVHQGGEQLEKARSDRDQFSRRKGKR